MADVDLSAADGLAGFDFDPRGLRYPYTSRVSWPIAIDHHGQNQNDSASRGTAPRSANAMNTNMKRSTTPLQSLNQTTYEQPISHQQPQAYMPDWRLQQQAQSQSQLAYPVDSAFPQPYDGYAMPYQPSPTDYIPPQAQYDSGAYLPMTGHIENMPFNWQEFSNDLLTFPPSNGLSDMNMPYQNLPNSPTDTALEVRSLSSSDNGWTSVDYPHQSLDGSGSFQDPQIGTIFQPEQTLHGRTFSDSSYSDVELQSRHSCHSWGSYVDIPQHAIGSPSSDGLGETDYHHDRMTDNSQSPSIKEERPKASRPMVVTSSAVKPIRIKTSSSPQRSPTGRVSPPGRRQSKKSPNSKAAKPTIRRQSQIPKVETEKRVGRRKGPLRPEQRKQASEIRKLGACIRCKFLKKTVSETQFAEHQVTDSAVV